MFAQSFNTLMTTPRLREELARMFGTYKDRIIIQIDRQSIRRVMSLYELRKLGFEFFLLTCRKQPYLPYQQKARKTINIPATTASIY
jgi:uncharacterized protein YueI